MNSFTAHIGLGANLGDPKATLRQAMDELAALSGVRLVARSRLYTTAPVDAEGPDFVNAVVAIDTSLEPLQLLDAMQAIEAKHLRQRPYRNAPRTLDLDLLSYAEQQLDLPRLMLPHPRMHDRAFVLAPLHEIAPDHVVPGHGPVKQLLDAVRAQAIRVIAD